jgi:adenylyltransferase/sulfurtransferase
MLNKQELLRYQRQMILPNFGIEAQERLKSARVLVVGAGGLGAPVLLYLVAAGIGNIGIVDPDIIESSNLHRQILFTEQDCGKKKAVVSKEKLQAMNPHCLIEVFDTYLNSSNALSIAEKYEIIVDGTDNFPTRYLVNDLCVKLGIPNVHGSIEQFTGQVSVFNFPLTSGAFGPNYRDLYPAPPCAEEVKNCAESGVLGALPGIVGACQAMETIKIITQIGVPLSGKLWLFDALSFTSKVINFDKNFNNSFNQLSSEEIQLIDYEQFCGTKITNAMKTISAQELKEWIQNQVDFQLIDVREKSEFDQNNMQGLLIPVNEIPTRYNEILKDKKVVVHCLSGGRSGNVIQYLEENYGYTNLYNLQGGIIAWLALKA